MTQNIIKDPISSFEVYVFKSSILIPKTREDRDKQCIMSFNSIEVFKDKTIKLGCGLLRNDLSNETKELCNHKENYKQLLLAKEYIIKDINSLPIIDLVFNFSTLVTNEKLIEELFNIKFVDINKLHYRQEIVLKDCKITNMSCKLMPGRRLLATNCEAVYKQAELT